MSKWLYTTLICLIAAIAICQQNTFRCFNQDNNNAIKLYVEYKDDEPVSLKYKGQNSNILLVKKGKAKLEDKTSTFSETYIEMINNQIQGKYIFTHSGNYDYITYIRKDGKKFKFTINIDDSLDPNGNGFRTTPCF